MNAQESKSGAIWITNQTDGDIIRWAQRLTTNDGSTGAVIATASSMTEESSEIARCWLVSRDWGRNLTPVAVAFSYDIGTGQVIRAAPLVAKFIGQDARALIRWFCSLSKTTPILEMTG